MADVKMTETGLFAAVDRADDRMQNYGFLLQKEHLQPMNDFDKAHCIMLFEQGIISKEDAVKILQVLERIDELGPNGFPWGKGDLWPQKERYVIQQIGEEVGGRLHTGRSRQDVGNTTDRLYRRGRILDMAAHVNEFRDSLLTLAAAHTETVMPCYTWIQHAQSTTFAHYLLGFVFALARDVERILRAFTLTNQSPAGAALQTGTSHPLNRERVRALLGFDKVIRNTRDAAMNYDYLSESLLAASMTVADLLRLLEDFTLWHSAEFNFISLDDPWCGTSSIMPQKKNPYALMVIRGKAARIFGRSSQVFATWEGPTLGSPHPFFLKYDTDEAIDEFTGIFVLATGFLPTMRVNKALMLERAGEYWAQATDLADMLVREKGLSFRTAHHVIAELVVLANQAHLKPAEVNSDLIDDAGRRVTGAPLGLSESAIKNALNPLLGVKSRKVYGGTAPEDVQDQIEEAKQQLRMDCENVESCRKKIALSQGLLDTTVRALLVSPA